MAMTCPAWAFDAALPAACLEHLGQTSGHPVVVAVLSPRMVYSMTEWPRMRSEAVAQGFDVVAWRTPAVPEREWQEAANRAGWSDPEIVSVPPMPANCVQWFGQPNHFPFSTVVDRGRAHAWPVWGVLPDGAWAESLHVRLKGLESGRGGGER